MSIDTSLSGNAKALLAVIGGLVVALVVWAIGVVVLDLAGISGVIPVVGFALVAYFAGAKTRSSIANRLSMHSETGDSTGA